MSEKNYDIQIKAWVDEHEGLISPFRAHQLRKRCREVINRSLSFVPGSECANEMSEAISLRSLSSKPVYAFQICALSKEFPELIMRIEIRSFTPGHIGYESWDRYYFIGGVFKHSTGTVVYEDVDLDALSEKSKNRVLCGRP